MKGFETGSSHPDLDHLFFFLISKLVSFKKLNMMGRYRKIPKSVTFTFDFCFYLFFYICFFIFIILKLIYFIKNKNIMNFYKLFLNYNRGGAGRK